MIYKKLVFLSSILLILLLPLTLTLSFIPQKAIAQSSSTTSTTGDLLTYTNADYGFTIKYPSDWIVDYKNTSKYGLNTTNFKSPDGFGSVFVMVGIGNGTGMSFDNMSMYYSHHPITPGGRLLEFIPNNYFLSGHPAFRSIEINSFGPSEVRVPFDTKMMTFFTTLGGKAYFVAYAALLERFPDYLQTAQTMIDSFQIINKQ